MCLEVVMLNLQLIWFVATFLLFHQSIMYCVYVKNNRRKVSKCISIYFCDPGIPSTFVVLFHSFMWLYGWRWRHSLGCRIKFISAGALHEYREHICHAIQPQLLSRELSSVCLGQIVFLFIYFAVKACILIILMEVNTQYSSGSQNVAQNLIACIFNSFNVFI